MPFTKKYFDEPTKFSSNGSLTSSSSSDEEELEDDELSAGSDTSPFIAKGDSSDDFDAGSSRSFHVSNALWRSRLFRLVVKTSVAVGLFIGVAFLIMFIKLPWLDRDGLTETEIAAANAKLMRIRRCSYEDLDSAFNGVINPPHFLNSTTTAQDSEPKCWNLAEQILRIPAMAIDHRHFFRLGGGSMGGVYAVAVHLSGQVRDDGGDKCIVAMKSDHCHMKNPLRSNWLNKRTKHSCIERNTFLLNPTSYMGAEYNGAIIYHSLQRMKKQNLNPNSLAHRAELGVLPTWGVVQDVGHPTRSRVRHNHLRGFPHHDATIKAVIMPIIDFEPLSGMSHDHKRDLIRSARSIARAMLPAAVGLKAVAGMRLAFLDILPKNVGFRVKKSKQDGPLEFSGMLYDQSFLTYQDKESCGLPEEENAGCNFCMDPNFSHNKERNDLGIDVEAFLDVFIPLIKESPDESSEKHNLAFSLKGCKTAQDLIDVLNQYQ